MLVQIKRSSIHSAGSCNFCFQGELSLGGDNFLYPYDKVYELSGRCLGARICDKCLEELISVKEKNDAEDIANILAEN